MHRPPHLHPLATCALVAALATTACGGEVTGPPMATPTLSMSLDRVPLGSPVDMTYRFEVTAPFTTDYRVLVHLVDSDQELMWADVHDPPTPTTEWQPGQVIEYTRTVFFPIYPYIGPATVLVGLYGADRGERAPLDGDDTGQRAYRVATVEVLPQTENAFVVFGDGWHLPETSETNPLVEWQWSEQDAVLSIRNPMRDALFYLHVDQSSPLVTEPQEVTITVGGEEVDRFTLPLREELIRRIPISAAQFGQAGRIDIAIHVDRVFVPADLVPNDSVDTRELGIRVFHAFIQ